MNKDERLTENWIKANGLNVGHFNDSDIKQLQAQQIAHRLLKENGNLLTEKQIGILNNFNKAMNNKQLRSKLTQKQCYAVMNIGTEINRKLFKAYKKTQR